VNGESACAACRELLPWYVSGSASPVDRAFVERHSAGCADCASALDEWRMLAATVWKAAAAQPAMPFEASWDALSARLQSTSAATPAGSWAAGMAMRGRDAEGQRPAEMPAIQKPAPRRLAGSLPHGLAGSGRVGAAARMSMSWAVHVWCVARAQAGVLRRAIWLASALAIALAILYAALLPGIAGELDVLTFALPLIAGVGTAFLYGPETDAGLELALAAPTSPRIVLLSRFLLLFSYDAGLALAGTLLLAALRGQGLWVLAVAWIGPMALLATVSLAVSVLLGPVVAMGATGVLWGSRIVHLGAGVSLQMTPGAFLPTSPGMLGVSLALLLLAAFFVSRRERLFPDMG
jgi:hypothetical protein